MGDSGVTITLGLQKACPSPNKKATAKGDGKPKNAEGGLWKGDNRIDAKKSKQVLGTNGKKQIIIFEKKKPQERMVSFQAREKCEFLGRNGRLKRGVWQGWPERIQANLFLVQTD